MTRASEKAVRILTISICEPLLEYGISMVPGRGIGDFKFETKCRGQSVNAHQRE